MKPKISLISLGVGDFRASLEFYRDGLGFQPHNFTDGEDFCMFALAGTWLAIFPRAKLAEDIGVSSQGSGFTGFALAHNVESEAAVDELFKLAVAAGAKPIKSPQKVFWGGYSGYFADPDHYYWEVAYNPFTDLT